MFAGVLALEIRAVAHAVRRLEGSRMRAAHAGQLRRIVAGHVLRARRVRDTRRGQQRTADCHADAVQEIAARDVRVHAEFAIPLRHSGSAMQPGFRVTQIRSIGSSPVLPDSCIALISVAVSLQPIEPVSE